MKTTNRNNEIRLGRMVLLTLMAVVITWANSTAVLGLTRIRDISRPLGERSNKLIGQGIVVGLNGTGDGGDALVAIRPLREMLEKLGNPVDLSALKNARNFAYVTVTAELGRNGVLEGDQIDVYVQSPNGASSLEGGFLVGAVLQGSHPDDDRLYANAQGPISITDSENPTSGVVKNGADIETNIVYHYVDYTKYPGKAIFTIVLDSDQDNWQVAKTVADNINEEMASFGDEQGYRDAVIEATATIISPKFIEVIIPEKQAQYPAPYIARIMNLTVPMPDPEAVVVINEKAGVIVVTGNVEIAPVIVHVSGMTIRIVNPEPQPRPGKPVVSESEWGKLDTANTGGVKLTQLMEALDQLQVPIDDKINAIYEINRAGALRGAIHAEY